jgi:uncharacterized repeat protein (TIGR03806 family)
MRFSVRVAGVFAAALLMGAAPAPAPVSMEALLAEAPPPTLQDYRLFADAAATTPNAGVIPFAVNTPLFSDYAEKQRFVYVPKGQQVRYRAEGAFEFPVGSALVKTFAYPADFRRPDENVRVIETRLLIRKKAGWTAHAYVWNADRTQAVLKRAGTRTDVSFVDAQGRPQKIDYAVPNQNQCKECHSVSKVLAPIGPKARNLNGDYAYADGTENQLARWRKLGILAGAPEPAAAPRTAVWTDLKAPLEARARAYLDANCGHCHSPKGIASNSGLFLQSEETRPSALGIGKRPVAAGRGSGGLEVAIDPGHPERSILVHRMESNDPGVMMPELGRSVAHAEGLALVKQYVASLKP